MRTRDQRIRAPLTNALNLVGERIKARCKAEKIRQNDLIARLAIVTGGRWIATRLDVTRLTGGMRSCTDGELVALAVALDVDVSWLLAGDVASSPPKTSTEIRDLARSWEENPPTNNK